MLRLLMLLVAIVAGGCIPTQPQDTPVSAQRLTEPATGGSYYLYKPSYYDGTHDMPLVVTLHGTHGWDSAAWQIAEWKALAEEKGLIVLAPELRSPQGILPVITSLWVKDLQRDERLTLGAIDEVCRTTRIDKKAVLITGFSAGGYPLYYVGLRNPQRFNMLIARSCNSDDRIFKYVQQTQELRDMPMAIFCGRDELKPILTDTWGAFEFVRRAGCKKAKHYEVLGGHLRRPEQAYRYWLANMPQEHRKP
jgi:predicted peptidase